MTLSQYAIMDAINISKLIIDNQVDKQPNDTRPLMEERRIKYNELVKPMLERYKARHGGSPNQLMKRFLHNYVISRDLRLCDVQGFKYWGNGYVWPYEWSAIHIRASAMDSPQLLILLGKWDKDYPERYGIEFGFFYGWHVGEDDPTIRYVRQNFNELFSKFDFNRKDYKYYGNDYTETKKVPDKNRIMSDWGYGSRITKWVFEDEIGPNITSQITEFLDSLLQGYKGMLSPR